MAPFKADGIYDSCNDLLTIVWMVGKSTGKRLFTKEVGIGSSKHDFEFPDNIILASSSSVMLANDLILSVLEVNTMYIHVDILPQSGSGNSMEQLKKTLKSSNLKL